MEVLPTLTPTNRMFPTGGVIKPMQRLKVMIIPNSTALKPQLKAIGKKIGVKIKTAGVVSKKVPTKSRIKLMMSMITIGLSLTPFNNSPTAVGIFTKEITQDMIEEIPIRRMIMPVISAESA